MAYTREELNGASDRALMLMCRRVGIYYGRTRPTKERMINDLLASFEEPKPKRRGRRKAAPEEPAETVADEIFEKYPSLDEADGEDLGLSEDGN